MAGISKYFEASLKSVHSDIEKDILNNFCKMH